MPNAVEFRLLGPVRVVVDGQPVTLGARQERFVLAVLALAANRMVTVDRLVDLTWPAGPPRTARRIVQTQVSRLRGVLAAAGCESATIRADGPGYRLDCDPDAVDAHRFAALLHRARNATDDDTRVDLLDAALASWQGPPLAGTAPDPVRELLCRHLEDARLDAAEDRLEANLRLGRLGVVIEEATRTVASSPERHRPVAALMRALHRSGRTAEALAVCRRARDRLAAEHGLDLPAALRELEVAILRDVPDVVAVDGGRAPPGPGDRAPVPAERAPVPAELPADLVIFTGRDAELAGLLGACPADPPAPVVAAVDGMAGVGKTAFAVHVAHRLAGRFPDGQLFVDLHGHTRDLEPAAPADVLERLLRTLGVPGERIPGDLDGRSALLRSSVAGRRLLIVLDNARGESQVGPLLPGEPGCLVLVTSRQRLTGLDGTVTVSLDVLSLDDAVTLFRRTAGDDRTAGADDRLLVEVVQRCGRLPLAIRVAAGRFRSRTAWTLRHLADRLARPDRLTELRAGQRAVAAALDLSYQGLEPEQRRLYRLAGLHPGPDLEPFAAAALAGAPPADAGRWLDALLEAHLIGEPTPGRYRFHELVRAHAASTAEREEPEPRRRAAVTRLLEFYGQVAAAAAATAYPDDPGGRPHAGDPAGGRPRVNDPAGRPAPPVDTAGRATAWLDDELANLLAAAAHAGTNGWPAHASRLAATLHRHLRTRGRYSDALALHTRSLTAARATGHGEFEIEAHIGLGDVHYHQGRYDLATEHFTPALELSRTSGRPVAGLRALEGLGNTERVRGDYPKAAGHFGAALAIARDVGHRTGELNALWGLGNLHHLQGRREAAIDCYRQALAIARDVDDRPGELNALIGLGSVHRVAGDADRASDCYGSALTVARAIGYRPGQFNALVGLGNVHRTQGRHRAAAERFAEARTIAEETGSRHGELYAVWGLGESCRLQGDHRSAAAHLESALRIAGDLGDRNGQFEVLNALGSARRAASSPEAAVGCHRRALDLATDLGQPVDQARAHHGLGHAFADLGDVERAREHWRRALGILDERGLGHTEEVDAAELRTNLARLDRAAAGNR